MKWYNEYQKWLSPSQSLHNAQNIINLLYVDGKDWTKESLSALLGNMCHESSINPNMYEYGYAWSADRGFGLVQWTPRSKYWNWAIKKGFKESELRNGEAQVERLDFEVENGIQYIANGHQRRYGKSAKYNFSFADFRKNTHNLSINQLTEAFMWNYEGPNYTAGSNSLADRQAFANRVFKELDFEKKTGSNPGDSDNDNDDDSSSEPINDGFDPLKIFDTIENKINDALSTDLFQSGHSQIWYNDFLRIQKQLNNTYKVNVNIQFKKIIDDIVNDLLKLLPNDDTTPPTQPDEPDKPDEPDEPGNSNEKPILPMKLSNLYVTSEYGPRKKSGGGYRLHGGIDLGVGGNPTGQPVYAVMSGTVRAVNNSCHSFNSWGCGGGGGNYITIEHDNDSYTTHYIHLGQNSVPFNVGDKVKQGDKIGEMANSGSSQGIHLHLVVSTAYPIVLGAAADGSDGTTINPRNYISKLKDVPKV